MFTIHTKACSRPAMSASSYTMEGKDIHCNEEPVLPGDKGNAKLFVIGHEHGAICAVWASNEQDALDCAVDLNALDCLMADDQTAYDDESLTPLGNASELFDLSYAWIQEASFDVARDWELIKAILKQYYQDYSTLA